MTKTTRDTMTRLATMVATMVCTIALACGTAYAGTVKVVADGNTAEGRELLTLVNADRANYGLAPLAWDECLEMVALQRGCEQTLLYSHTRPDGTFCSTAFPPIVGFGWQAENLAWNQRSVAEVNRDWIASPGHHANMLLPDVTRFAAAHVVAADGNHYWVECFMTDTGYANKGIQPIVGPVVAQVKVS